MGYKKNEMKKHEKKNKTNKNRVPAVTTVFTTMFRGIKSEMDTPNIHRIIAFAAYDESPAGTRREVEKYQSNDHLQFFGWVVNDEVLGICGFEEYPDKVKVHLLSVDNTTRSKGVGSAMIKALKRKFHKPIEAETGDGAIGFYRKCSFKDKAFAHPERGTRYTCVLPLYAMQ